MTLLYDQFTFVSFGPQRKYDKDYQNGAIYHPPKPIYDTSLFNSRLISDIDELSVSNPCSILHLLHL